MYSRKKELSRRAFLRLLGITGMTAALAACGSKGTSTGEPTPIEPTGETARSTAESPEPTAKPPEPTAEPQPTAEPTREQAYLAVARGADPATITTAAVAALGGIERFVKSGNDVIIKPNICVAYHTYEYAATTNPEVVATLVRLCRGAGAARVRVMDNPFGGTAEDAYETSGIAEAVGAAGGEMEVMNPNKFIQTTIPQGLDLKEWPIYRDVLNADVVINVPIAKHHALARLTLGGKNLMGVIIERQMMHRNLGQRIADLVGAVRPTLTVVDAVRIMTAHGPTGGSLDDVRQMDTVIASPDIVAADAYAATLFDLTGPDIAYVQAAADMGLGTLDLEGIKMEEISA